MDFTINEPCNGNNVVDGLNTTDRIYWKGKWNLLVN